MHKSLTIAFLSVSIFMFIQVSIEPNWWFEIDEPYSIDLPEDDQAELLFNVEGNPIDNLMLLMNKNNIPVIMKDGKICKNTL